MRKYIGFSIGYAIAALCGGVFYREFTKWNGFTGDTTLSRVHPHLFLLGMVVFLLAALFASRVPLQESKLNRAFLIVYNIGLPLVVIMMLIRGVCQVLGAELPASMNAAISGIAGIGHAITAAGLLLFLFAIFSAAKHKHLHTK